MYSWELKLVFAVPEPLKGWLENRSLPGTAPVLLPAHTGWQKNNRKRKEGTYFMVIPIL
jgi:hypothetical protein